MINLTSVVFHAKNIFVKVSVAYMILTLALMVSYRIPPYSQGTCLGVRQNPAISFKIVENHFFGGYSTVEMDNIVQKTQGALPYSQLRMIPFEKVNCNE